ncbi:MAG: long-chain-acyl-CoA synthetase [Desulfobacterales bacterium]|nr:MAG: long-chain-acyl-CoA synthetase [Desulfobacterales bacterium]
MPAAAQSKSEGLISRTAYIWRWLCIGWRLPSIMRARQKAARVAVENRESWGSMLEENAARFPDNAALKAEDARLSYQEYNQWANRCAHYFISQGLQKGDVAAVFLETRPELLIAYTAIAKIGAVNCMINTNLRQDALKHCLTLNPAAIFIVGEEVLGAFEEVKAGLDLSPNPRLYFVADQGRIPAPPGYIDLKEAVKAGPASNPATTAKVRPGDTIAYVFTSGTTGGMPKAAIITHGRLVRSRYYNGNAVLNIKPTDTIYIPLPFFHTNALALSWPCMFANGAAVAIRRKFSVRNFWQDVHTYHATVWCYVGELCRYLMNQAPQSDDRRNPLRKIIGNGLRADIWKDFKKRFGIGQVYEIYGAAESNLYFVNLLNLDGTVGMCRLPYAIVKYDADADEPVSNDRGFMQRVGVGATGLLLGEITEANPFHGYTSREATASKILRNVFTRGDAWFNTGDLVRNIGFNHVQFIDRTGDTYRWKGENVSTTEVEKVAHGFPRIGMAAAYGVVMPGGDGRAGMVAVIPANSAEDLDWKRLAQHFQHALPPYAVPRFVRLRTQFDYTPTHKISKVHLKNEGFDPGTIADPIYVLLPGATAYQPLTGEIYAAIMDHRYKF